MKGWDFTKTQEKNNRKSRGREIYKVIRNKDEIKKVGWEENFESDSIRDQREKFLKHEDVREKEIIYEKRITCFDSRTKSSVIIYMKDRMSR